MSSLSINDAALRVGINYHMSCLNQNVFIDDADLVDCIDWDDDADLVDCIDSDDADIVQPRDLFFDVNTAQKTIEKDVKVRFRDATNRVVMKLRKGGKCAAYKMHPECFDDNYHHDFTKILTDQQSFYRGGALYNRPLGSMRYALNVLDKYEDNAWLGKLDNERESANSSIDGEWPVAYHGTMDPRAADIVASGGLDVNKGTRFLFGHGIYCTPDPKTALAYASRYKYDGKYYKLILQARVDPAHREIVPKSEHEVEGLDDYWIIKQNDAIRPYGICIFPC